MEAAAVAHADEHHHGPPPANRSAWVEKGLIEKIERESGKPVQHVEANEEVKA